MIWRGLRDCTCGHPPHPGIKKCRLCCCNEYEPASTVDLDLKTYYGLEPGLLLLVLE